MIMTNRAGFRGLSLSLVVPETWIYLLFHTQFTNKSTGTRMLIHLLEVIFWEIGTKSSQPALVEGRVCGSVSCFVLHPHVHKIEGQDGALLFHWGSHRSPWKDTWQGPWEEVWQTPSSVLCIHVLTPASEQFLHACRTVTALRAGRACTSSPAQSPAFWRRSRITFIFYWHGWTLQGCVTLPEWHSL